MSGSTSTTVLVCFISKPIIFIVERYVVPTWSYGPLKSEYCPRGIQSDQRDVSHRNAQTWSTGASTRIS